MDDVRSHEQLGRIFIDDPAIIGFPRSHGPEYLAEQLMNAAAWHSHIAQDLSIVTFRDKLAIAIDALTALVDTQVVKASLITGFAFELPSESYLTTPWGTLRPRTAGDDVIIRALGDGSDAYQGGAILETPCEVRWTLSEDGAQGPTALVGHDRDECKLLSLSVLFCLAPENRRPPPSWFCTRIDPISSGLPGGSMRTRLIRGPVLSDPQLNDLKIWIEAIANRNPGIIPVHRTLSMFERGGVDGFIDAVIVWEALFGTGDVQELAYRVSLNMASVMSHDPKERVRLQREIKKLYTTRSKVVHGGKHLGPAEAHQIHSRSQELTITAFMRLVRDHPTLMNANAQSFVEFVLTTGNAGRLS